MRPNFRIIMKKVFNLFFWISLLQISISCDNSDDAEVTPPRDYAEQYEADLTAIEEYLHSHYIESVTNNPGQPDDQNVKISAITDSGTQTSIWDQTVYPLNFINVESNDITYKVYYLTIRQGTGTNSKSPCNYDSVLAAYKGNLLDDTVFEENYYPSQYLNLNSVIKGWSELFPKLKTGNYQSNPDGTISYFDFGAAVFFIPSGLGYYNVSRTNIPAYSPLVFSVKLFEIQRIDHDQDGIFSYLEDINGDGYLRDNETTYEDDTDQDGTPNFLDVDDDGDTFLTKKETEYIINEVKYYYPFNGAAVDDPATPQNETLGIPSCSGDFTTSNRVRKHLDASCH